MKDQNSKWCSTQSAWTKSTQNLASIDFNKIENNHQKMFSNNIQQHEQSSIFVKFRREARTQFTRKYFVMDPRQLSSVAPKITQPQEGITTESQARLFKYF
tara:strand:+ start:112 stop:414 length:303 start_codon:yes stop_codon:yes gene_type:complete